MSSQRQYFVDIIRLPVSLPALSRVVAAKQKNISGFNKGGTECTAFFTSLFLHFLFPRCGKKNLKVLYVTICSNLLLIITLL